MAWMDDFVKKGTKPSKEQVEAQLSIMKAKPKYKKWLALGRPARVGYKSWQRGLRFLGGAAVGALASEAFGSAATLENIQSSPHYEEFRLAVLEQNWSRAYQLADLIEEHVLSGANDRTNLQTHWFLYRLIQQAEAEAAAEKAEEEKDCKCS